MTMVEAAVEAYRSAAGDMEAAERLLETELRKRWRGDVFLYAARHLLRQALQRDRNRIRLGGNALTQQPPAAIDVQGREVETAKRESQWVGDAQNAPAPARPQAEKGERARARMSSTDEVPASPAVPMNDVIRRFSRPLPGWYGWCPRDDGLPFAEYTPEIARRAMAKTVAVAQTHYERQALFMFVIERLSSGQKVGEHIPEKTLAEVASLARKRFSETVSRMKLLRKGAK